MFFEPPRDTILKHSQIRATVTFNGLKHWQSVLKVTDTFGGVSPPSDIAHPD